METVMTRHPFFSISISRVRIIARRFGKKPGDLLSKADRLADQIHTQGVDIADEKGVQPAAVMIGLGIRAVILASSN